MAIKTIDELFVRVSAATRADEIRSILTEIGDHADVELDQPFGPLNASWHAFNDSLSNISSIGLGTKPGRSLTERITNAMDAVLEARKPNGVALPHSCWSAMKQWFGRPITGPDEGLFRWKYSDGDFDKLIHVILQNSGAEGAPTVDVLDAGIGLASEQLPSTILSIQRGNKLTKLYLIGAFGQGGASTLAFADYAVIISRHKDSPSVVSFTVIRVLNLSDAYKEDAYAYLTLWSADGAVTILHVTREGALPLYPTVHGVKLPTLAYGTLVRHIAYKLPGISGSLSPSPGNLYHFLHTSMFDPLFPFRVVDIRDAEKARDELVTGNRNRLMRRVVIKEKEKEKDEDTEDRIQMRYHRPMEYVTPHGGTAPTIGIEYWVVFASKKGKEGQVLRHSSSELFAQPRHPIIGTLNGQNQGELTAKTLQDIGLGMVARHLVIHIDASQANSKIRRELFVTNREGFKEGDVLHDLTRVLQEMLQEDEELYRIEKELTARLTRREAESASKEVKEQIARLLLDAGFEARKEGPSRTAGDGTETTVVRERKKRPYVKLEPLPTLPYPQVTKFMIFAPRPGMEIRKDDTESLLIQTDADAQFDREGRVAMRAEPGILEQVGKAPLRGGRLRWRLRPTTDAPVGATGRIVATLTRPDGSQLHDEIPFNVLVQREETTKKAKGPVPDFDVLPVSPEDEALWGELWPNIDSDAAPEQLASVAYKPLKASGQIVVYYSTVFGPYKAMIEKLKLEGSSLAELFETSYKVWIGYHGILQENAKPELPEGLSEEDADTLREDDRVRVAQMQVKQALQVAQLRQELLKQKSEAE
jgi:hypothetical protein